MGDGRGTLQCALRQDKTVYLGLGSNIGDRRVFIEQAVQLLAQQPTISVEKVSSLIETDPVDACGPKFFNGVVKIATTQSPQQLLKTVQQIEDTLGRQRPFENAPRTIDIDILLFGQQTVNEPDLQIPHPRMRDRDFVLKPLFEIAPQLRSNFKMEN